MVGQRLLRVYGPAKAAGAARCRCERKRGMARLADLVEMVHQAGAPLRALVLVAQGGAIGAAISGFVRIEQLRHQAGRLAARSARLRYRKARCREEQAKNEGARSARPCSMRHWQKGSSPITDLMPPISIF